jgi:cardiolipin synthase (CMP-forming)
LSIPNLITLARIVLVPVVVWAILAGQAGLAFSLFVVAGVSDAVDGFLAKRFGMTTVLGAYLDPLADKALLVSIYVTLGINSELPLWLVILVVSRDIMIVGGVLLSWLLGHPMKVKPLIVSKLNTLAQIVLASVALGALGLGIEVPGVKLALTVVVALTTALSVAAYLSQWLRHMHSASPGQ